VSDLTGGTLDRLGLLDPGGADLVRQVAADGVETVRFLFTDPHGQLHGKALTVSAVPSALKSGITAPSTLLLKLPSGRTAFPVWSEDAGFGPGVMTGAGDMLLVPDAKSYRRLPWAPHTAWVMCDVVQPDGAPIPFAPRTVLHSALADLAAQGFGLTVGLEVEFHIFRVTEPHLTHGLGGMPGPPPETAPLNHGYQLLSEQNHAAAGGILGTIRRNAQALGLPVRSVEVEFGPSQFEVTFDPAPAADHAETMVMFRTMVRTLCAAEGLHASFMCRPALPDLVASGWHLHQSLVDLASGANSFASDPALAHQWIAGLLRHAAESCLLTNPTVNSFRRFQPHQMAPDRIQWGLNNRGAMLRALLSEGDPASRVENRAPDPSATPHYLFASQIRSGLSGISQKLAPPDPVETPYASTAPQLPASLGAALEAFSGNTIFPRPFTDFLHHLKSAEWQEYLNDLSAWEHRQYFARF
jgi:glutamine synthetase